MATNLTSIFGYEIVVAPQPRLHDRQYSGFPGAHGLAGMNMGSRGRVVVISGRLAYTGDDYTAARTALQAEINTLDSYMNNGSAAYSFEGETYSNLVFEKIELKPGRHGKVFHYTADGYVFADFVCLARDLL